MLVELLFTVWVFIPAAYIYITITKWEARQGADQTLHLAWLVGNLASLASLAHGVGPYCVTLFGCGTSPERGWPIAWIGVIFLGPFTLAADIVIWFVLALCVLKSVGYLGAKMHKVRATNAALILSAGLLVVLAGVVPAYFASVQQQQADAVNQIWRQQSAQTRLQNQQDRMRLNEAIHFITYSEDLAPSLHSVDTFDIMLTVTVSATEATTYTFEVSPEFYLSQGFGGRSETHFLNAGENQLHFRIPTDRILSAKSALTADGPYWIRVTLESMVKDGAIFAPFNITYVLAPGEPMTPNIQPASMGCKTKPYRKVDFGK
jgi:hypothetical protein